MTELYKAAFAYDTDKEDELSLKVGETVRISNKESPDWWLAERLDNNKEFGLVPSNFLEKIPVTEGIILAIVTNDYLAQSPEELSLQKNRVVTILDRNAAEGWWKGDLNGKTGLFPADHVELVEESEHPENESKSKKDGFKLAAYGVKQGGIGSILAGGFSLKRSPNRSSINERPSSTNSASQSETSAPSIPNKPHPSLINTAETKPVEIEKGATSSRAIVLHDYVPESNDEIKLMRGEYVTVVDQLDNDGWWKGTSETGTTGLFPSNYVQILEEYKPPQRPVRARPATVKTETPAVLTETMARPPPVPVTTRPTSLLTQREGSSVNSPPPRPTSLLTQREGSSVNSPPPRPTTTPPRPMTTPPVPSTRRTNSIISPPPIEIGHRRIPSIPLTSPDLPPMSPGIERPTRPVPRPTSTISSDLYGARSPEAHQNAINQMAKPPKMNFGSKVSNVVPSLPSKSRPVSTNDEAVPPVPKRSMPPLPEKSILPNNFDQSHSIERKTPPHRNTALPSTPDPLEVKIHQIVKLEIEKIRQEFETKLEQERLQREMIQAELDDLKASLI